MAENLTDDNDSTRGVTKQELQSRQARATIAEWIHVMIPGKVQRFDAGKCDADVQVLVKDFRRTESGQLVADEWPLVCHVPVMFLTAGGFTFTVPIVAGETTGALLFAERSLDRWLAGRGSVVDPEIYTRFNQTDAIFLPGLLPFGNPMDPAPPTDHATAGSITGKRIHFRQNTICIGDESGSKKIVLDGDAVNAGSLTGTVLVSGVPVSVQFTYTPAGGGTPVGPSPTAALSSGTVASSATQGKSH